MASNASRRAYQARDTDDPFAAFDFDDGDDGDDGERAAWSGLRKANRERRRASEPRVAVERVPPTPRRGPTRAARAGAESFKCRQCRAFIGPTLTGGRHRNHCPLCLYSRHVDGKRPGDRASDCGSLMAPVARFARPDGEVMLVHRCLGCGFERHNRLAADDNTVPLTRLPLVAPCVRRGAGDAGDVAERDVA